MESLEEKFVAAYDRLHQPIWDLSASFSAALERMLAQKTADGDLDATLEIRNEIGAFGDGRDFDTEAFLQRPAEVEALASAKAIYARERERLWNEGAKARAELLGHYATALTELGTPDPDMSDAWRNLPNSQAARAASEWVRCGPGTEWHHYAAVIRPEMLKATEPPVGEP